MNSAGPSLAIDGWISCLKSGIVSPDMPTEVAYAFFHHLADLGIFERVDGELWRLTRTDTFEVTDKIVLAQRLDELASINEALFMPYFFHPPKDLPDIFSLKFESQPLPQAQDTGDLAGKKASDLSNLQIVRKVGRQLEPFIQLEKYFFSQVEGPNTSKEDARILFSYLLEKNREKGKPREWEQLSRRRHK
jgi:hypothetical protein